MTAAQWLNELVLLGVGFSCRSSIRGLCIVGYALLCAAVPNA